MIVVRTPALCLALALMALGVASVAGCPPGLEHPERFQTECPADLSVETLMREKCSGASCHGSGASPAAGLDLSAAGAFERMFGRPSDICDDLLISPDGPTQSLLVHKLTGETSCGARMPLGEQALSATEIRCVEQWIIERIPGATLPSLDAGSDGESVPDAGDLEGGGGSGGGAQ